MPTTKLKNGQLPDTISGKTVDNTNDINTTTTRLKITGGSNGQVLSTDGSGNLSWATAGGGGGGLGAPTAIVTKTADETITDSITLQDDDHLSYAMTNGKYYRFELHLFLTRTNTTASPGFRIAIDANSDGYFGDYGNGFSTASNLLVNGTTSRTFNLGVNGNVAGYGLLTGRIKATADFTLKLKFAQNTQSAATGSTIMKKSELWIWDLGT